MTISLSVVNGGPEAAFNAFPQFVAMMARHFRRLGKTADREDVDFRVAFHIPGSLVKPDWNGIRVQAFRRKDKILNIQVAVPESVRDDSNPTDFLRVTLADCYTQARKYCEDRKINVDLECIRKEIDTLNDTAG